MAENAQKASQNGSPRAAWNADLPNSKSLHISAAQVTIRNRDFSVKGAESRLDSNLGGMRK